MRSSTVTTQYEARLSTNGPSTSVTWTRRSTTRIAGTDAYTQAHVLSLPHERHLKLVPEVQSANDDADSDQHHDGSESARAPRGSCISSASLTSCRRHREASPGPTRKEMSASRRWSNKTPVRMRSARKRRGGGPSTRLRTVRHRLNSIGNRRMAEPSLWARTS